MKTQWAGGVGLVVLSVLGASGTASAHTSSITASCAAGRTTLSIQLTYYTGENSVLVTTDGATVARSAFGNEFRLRREVDGAADHMFTITVKAPDDPSGAHGWSFVRNVYAAACGTVARPTLANPVARRTTTVPPTATVTPVTTTPSSAVPSSTEVSSVLVGLEIPQSLASVSPLWALLAPRPARHRRDHIRHRPAQGSLGARTSVWTGAWSPMPLS